MRRNPGFNRNLGKLGDLSVPKGTSLEIVDISSVQAVEEIREQIIKRFQKALFVRCQEFAGLFEYGLKATAEQYSLNLNSFLSSLEEHAENISACVNLSTASFDQNSSSLRLSADLHDNVKKSLTILLRNIIAAKLALEKLRGLSMQVAALQEDKKRTSWEEQTLIDISGSTNSTVGYDTIARNEAQQGRLETQANTAETEAQNTANKINAFFNAESFNTTNANKLARELELALPDTTIPNELIAELSISFIKQVESAETQKGPGVVRPAKKPSRTPYASLVLLLAAVLTLVTKCDKGDEVVDANQPSSIDTHENSDSESQSD